jgi:predicted dehydrogenase
MATSLISENYVSTNSSSTEKKRYALASLSNRGIHQFALPLLGNISGQRLDLREQGELVAILEPDAVRARVFQERYPHSAPRYDCLRTLIAETSPDTVIVAGPDHTHAEQILIALEGGCDVIAEKPMVISSEEARRVLVMERATGRRVKVGFNMRYMPGHRIIKRLIAEGRIGRVINIEFNYNLDTFHGASYFRRWNRRRALSGSLAIHKCCHHLDLAQWWADSWPRAVFAFGALNYYGPKGAHRPEAGAGAEACPCFKRWHAASEPVKDEHASSNSPIPYPLQYPEPLSIYDREIDVEDTYASVVRYDSGAMLSYSCNFSTPWEGYQLGINGTRGRIETRHYVSPQRCSFPVPEREEIRLLSLFGENETIPIPRILGAHGGSDADILRDLFIAPGRESQKLGLVADSVAGAYAVANGEAFHLACQSLSGVTITRFELCTRQI